MRRTIRIPITACFVTAIVTCTFLWANLIPIHGQSSGAGSCGCHVDSQRVTLGWPIPYEAGRKWTTTYSFQPRRSPEVTTQKQFLRKGILINAVIGMLIGTATYWVTLHFEHTRLRFHLSTLFALTFMVAVFSATYSHMAKIETAIGSEYSLSRLLAIPPSKEIRVLQNAFGIDGTRFPFHIRVPLLFGIGAVFFVIGKAVLALVGRVFSAVTIATSVTSTPIRCVIKSSDAPCFLRQVNNRRSWDSRTHSSVHRRCTGKSRHYRGHLQVKPPASTLAAMKN